MMGKMGYDIVVSELSDNDLKFSQQAIKTYKKLQNVIWYGDLYRLISPLENPFASLMMVSEDKSRAVMFNYLTTNRFERLLSPNPIKFKGLDPTKKYSITEINLYPGTKSSISNIENTYTGDFLMTTGFNPKLDRARTSVVLEINELKFNK